MKFQKPRGTEDFIDTINYNKIINIARNIAESYNFKEVMTPIFEHSEVFLSTLGNVSDIVSKEMYTFKDRGSRELTLRPEFTAGIMRMIIENNLYKNTRLPLKLFTHGALFRYERPQKGRYRQFHQINFEIIGDDSTLIDTTAIMLANDIICKLGIKNSVFLEYNSLGDAQTRAAYRLALMQYFQQHKNQLSPESAENIQENPLRILDSKREEDKSVVANAPQINNFYSEATKSHLREILNLLGGSGKNILNESTGQPAEIIYNPNLVRGLDYYTGLVFEFKTKALGSQDAIFAGGRYDNLAEQMGSGVSLPSIGFAAGIERLSELIKLNQEGASRNSTSTNNDGTNNDGTNNDGKDLVCLLVVRETELTYAFNFMQKLRTQGLRVDIINNKSNLGKAIQEASKIGAKFTIPILADEVASGLIKVKNLATKLEENFKIDWSAESFPALIEFIEK